MAAIFQRRFVLQLPFPVDEARRRLLAAVKTGRPICPACGQIMAGGAAARFCAVCGRPVVLSPAARPSFEFEGDVSPDGFRITRVIAYRNCCIPVIEGRFERRGNATGIPIRMNMHILGYVFLFGSVALSVLVLLSILAGQNHPPSSGVLYLLPMVLPAGLVLVSWLAFAVEVGAARAALGRIWESVPPPVD